jgi:hypothetical protein
MPPVLEQARCFRRDPPITRIQQVPPLLHVGTDLIDDRGRVVLLPCSREALAVVEDHLGLPLALPRFRFFGLGTGVIRSDRRRLSMIRLVGWPSASSSQWRPGKKLVVISPPHLQATIAAGVVAAKLQRCGCTDQHTTPRSTALAENPRNALAQRSNLARRDVMDVIKQIVVTPGSMRTSGAPVHSSELAA